mgnify:CR=1 FL=1
MKTIINTDVCGSGSGLGGSGVYRYVGTNIMVMQGRPVSDKSLLRSDGGARGIWVSFLKVLRATHVFSNNKPTKVTYADLLASDQTFTVWAPKDGLFNVDSLLAECQTVSGDSMCGQHFVQNHIAHFITNSTDEKQVLMLNNKYLDAVPGSFQGVSYASG